MSPDDRENDTSLHHTTLMQGAQTINEEIVSLAALGLKIDAVGRKVCPERTAGRSIGSNHLNREQ